MQHPKPSPRLDDIQEDHLRLAVLLDQIRDHLDDSLPVNGRIALLAAEFDHHAQRKEEALANIATADHAEQHKGHDAMRRLLGKLADSSDAGGDIRPLLDEVQRLFTEHLLPADRMLWGATS